jgi:hypothetical protein
MNLFSAIDFYIKEDMNPGVDLVFFFCFSQAN